jgi:hypothetical protein
LCPYVAVSVVVASRNRRVFKGAERVDDRHSLCCDLACRLFVRDVQRAYVVDSRQPAVLRLRLCRRTLGGRAGTKSGAFISRNVHFLNSAIRADMVLSP